MHVSVVHSSPNAHHLVPAWVPNGGTCTCTRTHSHLCGNCHPQQHQSRSMATCLGSRIIRIPLSNNLAQALINTRGKLPSMRTLPPAPLPRTLAHLLHRHIAKHVVQACDRDVCYGTHARELDGRPDLLPGHHTRRHGRRKYRTHTGARRHGNRHGRQRMRRVLVPEEERGVTLTAAELQLQAGLCTAEGARGAAFMVPGKSGIATLISRFIVALQAHRATRV